jgi:hypothetical protein
MVERRPQLTLRLPRSHPRESAEGACPRRTPIAAERRLAVRVLGRLCHHGRTVTFCPYCGQLVDASEVEEEHIVPAELGANLTVDACSGCNRASARNVDAPIQDHRLVEIRRARYDVRHIRHRGRRVQLNIVGHDSVGHGRQLWQPSPNGATLHQALPSKPVPHADGDYRLTVPTARADEHLQAALAQLQVDHPGQTFTVVGEDRSGDGVTFEHGWGIAPWVWPRFAAKVALGIGHLAMGEEFSRSVPAGMMRGLFREGREFKGMYPGNWRPQLFPAEFGEADDEPDLLELYEHAVGIEPIDGGLWFFGVLFGELGFGAPLATPMRPDGGSIAWLLDGPGRARSSTSAGLREALERRRRQSGGARARHRDLPRAEFRGVVYRIRAA